MVRPGHELLRRTNLKPMGNQSQPLVRPIWYYHKAHEIPFHVAEHKQKRQAK